jgi:hypothetical protein
MGMIPDPRQIGGGTPTPDPRLIGDGDGDGDRPGFRALLPWAKHLNAVEFKFKFSPQVTPTRTEQLGCCGQGTSLPASRAPAGKSRGFKVFLAARGWASTEGHSVSKFLLSAGLWIRSASRSRSSTGQRSGLRVTRSAVVNPRLARTRTPRELD